MDKFFIYAKGFVFAYFLFLLISSLGSLIFGWMLGYKFLEFSFFGFKIAKQSGHLVFGFTHFDTNTEVSMKLPHHSYGKMAAWEILQAVLVAVFTALCWMFIPKYFQASEEVLLEGKAVCIFLSFFLAWQVLFLIMKLNQMLGKSEKSVFWREKTEALNALNEGRRPRDLNLNYRKTGKISVGDVSYMQYELLKYYKELDAGNYEGLKPYVREFEEFLPNTWSSFNAPYFYELLFYYSFIEQNISLAERYALIAGDIIKQDRDINGKRIYAYYLYYTGKDKELAVKVAKEGMATYMDFDTRGLAYMERDLIQNLLDTYKEENFNYE